MFERKVYLDQLRVLAIVSIICCHVCCDFIIQNNDIFSFFKTFYMLSFFTLGRFIGIPIFIMISGALLINKSYSLREFVKKRFNRVFVPYIFWALIFSLFSVVVMHKKFTYELLLQVFFGQKGTVGVILWFIWMIMVVYIGIFIINKILEYGKSKSDKFENLFVNILVIFSLITYFLSNLGYFPYSSELLYYVQFIPYAIFGYALTNKDFTNSIITPDLLVVFAFFISVFGYLYFTWTVDINAISINKFSPGSYFQFIVMIIVFNIMLFFRYLPESNFNRINNFLSSNYVSSAILSISRCSFGIYFIHYLILKFLQNVYLKQIGLFDHPLFWTPILLIVVFLSSWFIMGVMAKIPILNKLSGVS